MILYKILLLLLTIIIEIYCQSALLEIDGANHTMMDNNIISDQFASITDMNCYSPSTFIFNDTEHTNYLVHTLKDPIIEINSYYQLTQNQLHCANDYCKAILNNGCNDHKMNEIFITLASNTKLFFKVNCSPDDFYKPFEWGLFILIFFSTIVITLTSMYSRAWSYGGVGLTVTGRQIVLFNLIIVVSMLLAYFFPEILKFILKIVGSGLGTLGVMVCLSQSLWLLKIKAFLKPIVYKIRILDIVSFIIGAITTTIYWLSAGNWIINNILAVCMIIACIKLIKIRSLKTGFILLNSLLIIEILGGLFVHYILEVSYNNLVINLFQSPIIVAFPSITPQLFRKCAWLPITNLVFPGIVISYLRRFDLSRSTYIYLLFGYLSFYVGSMLWMIVDMLTIHALPFAIISQPVTFLFVMVTSHRRGEFNTIWRGQFYDQEIPDNAQQLLKNRQTGFLQGQSGLYSQLTNQLRISKQKDDQQSQQI